MTVTRRARLVPFVVGTALLAACTGLSQPNATDSASVSIPAPSEATRSTSSESPNTATSAAPSATSIAAVQRQVLAAYLGMQHAFQAAEQIPDPDAAELRSYAAGDALTLLTSGLTSLKGDGLRGTGETRFDPKVIELAPPASPTQARVEDCMDTAGSHVVKIDGSAYTDTPGGLRLVVATLEQIKGAWKVTGLGIHEVGSCTA